MSLYLVVRVCVCMSVLVRVFCRNVCVDARGVSVACGVWRVASCVVLHFLFSFCDFILAFCFLLPKA